MEAAAAPGAPLTIGAPIWMPRVRVARDPAWPTVGGDGTGAAAVAAVAAGLEIEAVAAPPM